MYFALCILYFVFWSEEHLSVWCRLQWCTALTSADRSTGPIHCWSMLWIEALFQVGCSVGTLTNSMYGKVHHRLHACLLTMVNGTGGVVIWSVLGYSFGQCATNASPRVAHTSRLTSADTQPPPLSTNQQNLLVPIPHVPPLKLTLNIGQTWDSEFYKVLINFCQELGIFFSNYEKDQEEAGHLNKILSGKRFVNWKGERLVADVLSATMSSAAKSPCLCGRPAVRHQLIFGNFFAHFWGG